MSMKSIFLSVIIITFGLSAFGATGIFGGYLTVDGTKYRSSSTYGGSETDIGSISLGNFAVDSDDLILSQFETLTFQNSGHSTFEFAFAYRIRLASDPKSTSPIDYAFVTMGDGDDIGSGNEKGEVTGSTIDLLSGITTPLAPTVYAFDFVHKVGAFEGGSNFERLANLSNPNPGDASWGSTNAFTTNFTVIPEPSSILMLGLTGLAAGMIALLKRRKRA